MTKIRPKIFCLYYLTLPIGRLLITRPLVHVTPFHRCANCSEHPAMSRKQRRETPLFLFAVTLYLHAFRVCFAVSLGQREDGVSPHRVQDTQTGVGDPQQGGWRLVEQVILGPNQRPASILPPSPDPEPGDGYQADPPGGRHSFCRFISVLHVSYYTPGDGEVIIWACIIT